VTARVDLRSDTVTKPTPEMRRRMAEAEVGDDVLAEDPTVRDLEEKTAALLGKQAALFVPSGTMGNEIALRVHARPGDEVLAEEVCHILTAEGGAPAALSGITVRPLGSSEGAFDPLSVQAAIQLDGDDHHTQTVLVSVENTHNRHGGTVYPQEAVERLAEIVHGMGVRLHIDGARLWNAAVASGKPPAELARPADSVMVCYSKGLGAPVGSAIAGSADFVRQARRERKRLGGGMRQAGILAAACLHALEHHRARLADDHRLARRLVEIAEPPGDVRVLGGTPETNIVIFALPPRLDLFAIQRELASRGILLSNFGPHLLRAITHLDVDDQAIETAGQSLRELLARPSVGAAAR
jgi:threonine aldolase